VCKRDMCAREGERRDSEGYREGFLIETETCNREGGLCSICVYVQPIAFGVSFNLNLHSESPWSLSNGTW